MHTTNSILKDSTYRSHLTLQSVQNRVTEEITAALTDTQPTLIEALPGSGKSRGVILAAAQTGEPITIFTVRGRKEQYEQLAGWCKDAGLVAYTLPSVYHECPTVLGDHDKNHQQEMEDLLNRGLPPARIHRERDWPCHKGDRCPFVAKLDIDPDQYDVLLGHYNHAYLHWAVEGRVPVFDEFPGDAFFTEIDSEDITAYLRQNPDLPFRNIIDLVEHRDDTDRRQAAMNRLSGLELRDESLSFGLNDEGGHVLSGLGVLTLLKSTDLGNGWEQTLLGNGQVGLFDRDSNTIYVINPPALPDNIVALDGTPTKTMWDLALGFYDQRVQSLNVQRALDDEERLQYVIDTQDLTIVQTTTDARTYSSGTYVKPQRDAALVTAIEDQHDCGVGIISSGEGLDQLPMDTDRRKTAKYGNLLGSNDLGSVNVGTILGSPHYGHQYIERWGALAGIGIESNDKKGMEKSYGKFGDQILNHMREHSVLQAVFRFARDGSETTVYVDTGALPDWIPVAAGPEDVNVFSWGDGEAEIIQAVERLGTARTREIADETSLSSRYVRGVLNKFCQRGLVSKRPAPDGRGGAQVYVDDGLSARNQFGPVDLPGPQACFSELSPNNTLHGRVPKKRSGSLNIQTANEAHHEAMRRRRRQWEHVRMETWGNQAV